MKISYIFIIIILLLTGCSNNNSKIDSQNHTDSIADESVHHEIDSDLYSEFEKFLMNDLTGHYGAILKEKINNNKFNSLWDQAFTVYDLNIDQIRQLNDDKQIVVMDTVLKLEKYYHWMQLEVLWDSSKKIIMDISLQPIQYITRANSIGDIQEGEQFAESIVQHINQLSPEQMGWRYQTEGSLVKNIVENVKIIDSNTLGYRKVDGGEIEALIQVNYEIKTLGQSKIVTTWLYLKQYEDQWQVEDIRMIDLKGEEA